MEKNYYLKRKETINGKLCETFEVLKETEFTSVFGGVFDNILSYFWANKIANENVEIPFEEKENYFFEDFVNNWNKYKKEWTKLEAVSYNDLTKEEQEKINNIIKTKELKKVEEEKRRNQKTKSVGNGERYAIL